MDEGTLAGEYQVLEELGSGSFGVVYKGIEKATGDIVAIKHIDLESSDDDIQDIQQEISVLSTCDSPFVTQYKTSFLRGHKLWIVMEYLGGGSCLDLLKAGSFSEHCVAIICREILLGLEYLHREGKIHRDIKAANILLAQSGKVKLADFGVAAQLTNIKSQRNTFVGTPFWMAPEVIQQAGYDFKADIWSLGVTAMEMIQGEPPNASIHPMKALFHIPKAPAPRLEGDRYSRDLKDFVAACLVKDPDRRPSASELLQSRFIRHAGHVKKLQELIFRHQAWDMSNKIEKLPKFYEETMKAFTKDSAESDWVFDTIRAPTVTVREIERAATDQGCHNPASNGDFSAHPEDMIQAVSISSPTRQHSIRDRPRNASTGQSKMQSIQRTYSTQRKVGVKAPLLPSQDFGNSSSTVRKIGNTPISESKAGTSDENHTTVERQKPNGDDVTKEALVGRRAFTKAVNPAMKARLAEAKGEKQAELLGSMLKAWEALNREDPEEEFHLLRMLLENVQRDSKLASLLPGSEPNTPQKQKLVLAQSNPHLKSHRRRQSSLLPAAESWTNNMSNLPGFQTPGMEHTSHLANVLYNKWTEGLSMRWPNL